jgi:DNA-binding MarR family transcriptional regulator
VARGAIVHVDLIHELLWARSDRLGRLTLIQKALAEEIGCTKFTMCRVFSRLEAEGRIKKLQGHRGHTWTYTIKDPRLFD